MTRGDGLAAAVAVPVVVATCAPRCLANWIAIAPTPPDPAAEQAAVSRKFRFPADAARNLALPRLSVLHGLARLGGALPEQGSCYAPRWILWTLAWAWGWPA
jgi:hypothetical protein